MTRENIIDKIHEFLLTHHANVECDTCINVFEDLRDLIADIETDEHPGNPWHSVADGDCPKGLKDNAENMPFIVKTKGGNQYLAYYASWFDEEYRAISHDFFDDHDCLLDVEYWMEIPELPK